jgi:Tol biopolymer transport system component
MGACLAAAGLTLTPVAQAAFPGANGKIVFSSFRNGAPSDIDLFTMNPDGSGQTRITSAVRNDMDPVWSADGRRIAYDSNQSPTGQEDIWIANADGTGALRLTSDPAVELTPAWSPDGSRIAFTRNDGVDVELYVMNADGSGQTNVSRSATTAEFDPAWSPDGTRIAFGSNRDDPCLACGDNYEIYTMRPDGSDVIRITSTFGLREEEPSWSPDGTKIAMRVETADLLTNEIFVMNADGSGRQNVTNDGRVYQSSPAWSPDGTRIAFRQEECCNAEIWAMDPDGANRTQLTSFPGQDLHPDWQPIPGPRRSDYKNAAQFCKAERDFLGEDAFAARYGGGADAYGKCVSRS